MTTGIQLAVLCGIATVQPAYSGTPAVQAIPRHRSHGRPRIARRPAWLIGAAEDGHLGSRRPVDQHPGWRTAGSLSRCPMPVNISGRVRLSWTGRRGSDTTSRSV